MPQVEMPQVMGPEGREPLTLLLGITTHENMRGEGWVAEIRVRRGYAEFRVQGVGDTHQDAIQNARDAADKGCEERNWPKPR